MKVSSEPGSAKCRCPSVVRCLGGGSGILNVFFTRMPYMRNELKFWSIFPNSLARIFDSFETLEMRRDF